MSKVLRFAGTAMKNFFSKPVTTKYPFVPCEYTPATRGRVVIDVDNCVLCGSCMRHCPSLAITVDRDKRTWSIQRMGCIQCADCVNNCPKNCLSMGNQYFEPGTEKVEESFEIPAKAGGASAGGGGGANIPVKGDDCVYCGLCAKKCPVEAITVDRAAKSWAVDAGACVGCGTCVDSCPKKCLTMGGGEAAPAAAASPAPVHGDGCVYCGACAGSCPVAAITVDGDAKTWAVDAGSCVGCGTCVSTCPNEVLSMGAAAAAAAAPAAAKAVDPAAAAAQAAIEADLPADVPVQLDGCVYCGVCAKKCPVDAITVDREAKAWAVDADTCVNCGTCVASCPKKCLKMND